MKPLYIFAGSAALSLAAVRAYNPVGDDVLILQYALTGHDPGYALLGSAHASMHWHVPGFLALLRFLFACFGPSLLLFRLTILTVGLLAIGLLAWTVRKSPLAVLALAGLLWTPILFASFREVRYDAFNLFLVAVAFAWLRGTHHPLAALGIGVACGLSPLFSIHCTFLVIVLSLTLLTTVRAARSAWCFAGIAMGLIVTMHYFPADRFMAEFTRSQMTISQHQNPGFLLLSEPWKFVHHFAEVTFFPYNHLFEPTTYMLYPILLAVIAVNWRTPSAFFVLSYVAVHALFSASVYPVVLNPLMVATGLELLDA